MHHCRSASQGRAYETVNGSRCEAATTSLLEVAVGSQPKPPNLQSLWIPRRSLALQVLAEPRLSRPQPRPVRHHRRVQGRHLPLRRLPGGFPPPEDASLVAGGAGGGGAPSPRLGPGEREGSYRDRVLLAQVPTLQLLA